MQLFLTIIICSVTASYLVSASRLEIIRNDGVCKSNSQISSFLSEQSSTAPLPILSFIDFSLATGGSIFGAVSGCYLDPSLKGIHIDVNSDFAAICAVYDSMFSAKVCGSKVADFCAELSRTVCFAMTSLDWSENIQGFDQIFRRLFTQWEKSSRDEPNRIVFIIESNENTNKVVVESSIDEVVRKIFKDSSKADIDKSFVISTIFVKPTDAESLASAKLVFKSIVDKSPSDSKIDLKQAGRSLLESWNRVATAVPKPIYSPAQRQSIFVIESAYASGVARIEEATAPWQERVGSGKTVGKFGDRVRQLEKSVMAAYNSKTAGTLTVRERARRHVQLKDAIKTATTSLFTNQLATLQTKSTNQLRAKLLSLISSGKNSPQEQDQAVRSTLFDYTTAASDLYVEDMGLVVSQEGYSEISAQLQSTATEFPDSAQAKLEEMRKVEAQAKKPRKRKNSRGVNIGLNLVGMLRPPGFGNFQGFVGYSTGLLGLPLELLLGIQNDGDAPEVMGEDREHPILRLQPKIHFDVDI